MEEINKPFGSLTATPSTPRSVLLDTLQAFGSEGKRTTDFADRILGGTEKNPMGFAEFTPADAPLAAHRSGQAFSQGDNVGGLIETLGFLPGVSSAVTKKARETISPLLKQLMEPESQTLLPKRPGVGEQIDPVQLTEGRLPIFGLEDKHDNSLVGILDGYVKDNDINVTVRRIRNADDNEQLGALLANGVINQKQYSDAIRGPGFEIGNNSVLLQALKDRGMIPGNSIKSGSAFGNRSGMLRAASGIAQSPELSKLAGNIKGSRITGAKANSGVDSMQEISLPWLRERAKKQNIPPVESRTLGEEQISGYFDDQFEPDYFGYDPYHDPVGPLFDNIPSSPNTAQARARFDEEGVRSAFNEQMANFSEPLTDFPSILSEEDFTTLYDRINRNDGNSIIDFVRQHGHSLNAEDVRRINNMLDNNVLSEIPF